MSMGFPGSNYLNAIAAQTARYAPMGGLGGGYANPGTGNLGSSLGGYLNNHTWGNPAVGNQYLNAWNQQPSRLQQAAQAWGRPITPGNPQPMFPSPYGGRQPDPAAYWRNRPPGTPLFPTGPQMQMGVGGAHPMMTNPNLGSLIGPNGIWNAVNSGGGGYGSGVWGGAGAMQGVPGSRWSNYNPVR
jgi:hypothetical protein